MIAGVAHQRHQCCFRAGCQRTGDQQYVRLLWRCRPANISNGADRRTNFEIATAARAGVEPIDLDTTLHARAKSKELRTENDVTDTQRSTFNAFPDAFNLPPSTLPPDKRQPANDISNRCEQRLRIQSDCQDPSQEGQHHECSDQWFRRQRTP